MERSDSIASSSTGSLSSRRFDYGNGYDSEDDRRAGYTPLSSPSVSSFDSTTPLSRDFDLEAQRPQGAGPLRGPHRPATNPAGLSRVPLPAGADPQNLRAMIGGPGSKWLDRAARFMPWAQHNAGTIFSIVGGVIQIGLDLIMTIINIAKEAARDSKDASREH